MGRHSLARLIAGAAIGGVALWATLHGVDLHELLAAAGRIEGPLVAASLAATFLSLLFVSIRWKLLFLPDRADIDFWLLFRLVVVGQMLNIVVPLRVGEVSRLYGAARLAEVPAGRVLATLAIEKAFELAVFGAAAITMAVLVALPPSVAGARAAWVAVPVVALIALFALAAVGPAAASWASRLAHVPDALRHRLSAFADTLAAGLRAAATVGTGGGLLVLSVGAMLASAAANQVLMHAFGLITPVWAGLALLIVLQVGSVPPSLPGRLGVFNYLTVVTLVWLGADRATAASFSLVLYVIAYLPKVALGAVFMATDARLRVRR